MGKQLSSFRKPRVYQTAFELQQEIFVCSKNFPAEERFSLTDQVRRSSRSVGANISEAWHKRRYVTHFVSKLTDAGGEQAETQHWLGTALACGYLTAGLHQSLLDQCLSVGAMLGRMMAKPETFCESASAHPSRPPV